jgi:exodeoxyribonuclease V beta subunit
MSQPLRYPRPPSLGKLGRGHNVVESSAGTGKTFLLEHLFVDLIVTHGIPVEEILVVTFTEKATAELVIRLRKLVAELAELRPEHPAAVAAASQDERDCWIIDGQAKRLLGQALLAFDRTSIFTIHGFCQRVLREHAFVQRRLFDEELVGAEAVFAEAFHEVLRGEGASNAGLVAILEAWLGSGKSIASLQELLRECDKAGTAEVRPDFDQARLAAAMAAWRPVVAGDPELGKHMKGAGLRQNTIDAAVGRLALVSEILEACAGNAMRLLARLDAEASGALAWVAERLPGKKPEPTVEALASRVRELHESAVPLAAVAARRLLPVVQERAVRRKRMVGRFDFQDMLGLVNQALVDPGAAGAALRASLRGRYQHALIDEFQDTDEIQWSIFRRIFVDAGDHHALTVIGDPKQAIYGFRGANVHTYLDARGALRAAGASSLQLTRNYRSTDPLIAATNLIFEQEQGFFRPGGGILYDHPVTCGRPERALLDASMRPAPPVVVFDLQTAQNSLGADAARAAVASAIVAELRELFDSASPPRRCNGGEQRRFKRGDVFILTFTNSDSRTLGRALGEARIAYAFYKQDKLFQTPEALEILDLLRAICAPEDRGLRARALLTGFFGLDLAEVAARAEIATSAGPGYLLPRFAALAEAGDIPALFAALIDDTGILRREVFADAGERVLTNLTHVLEILLVEWARSHASLPELADLLDAYVRGTDSPPGREGDLQRLETDRDAVQILTVHKAKGLEADVVFVYGGLGQKGNVPVHVLHEGAGRVVHVGPLEGSVKQRFSEERDDERSRLLYVALTRARYRLYLPRYPAALKRLDGPYARMNQRLDQLIDAKPGAGPDLLHVEIVECAGAAPDQSVAAPAVTPGDLQGRPELLMTPTVPADAVTIREKRRGFRVTSYTTVKRARESMAPAEEAVEPPSVGEPDTGHEPAPDRLPGGAQTGIFLHEILAEVSLPELAARPAFADWFASPGVAALLDKLGRRYGRPAEELPLAARLVHAAYTTPVRLGDGAEACVMPGLAAAKEALHELEFLYPIPEHGHPLLSQPAAGGLPRTWKVERGVVKGFVDFLFEHEGRVYVCDWKSDVLPDYQAAALTSHCLEHYDVQARIYTLAVLRLFGITSPADYARRFGGVVFCFLRGREGADERKGIHCLQPTWQAVLSWETDMLGQPFWGLAR